MFSMGVMAQPVSPGGAPSELRSSAEAPGGPVVLRSALRAEQGCHPRVVVQTVPDAQVSATVLAIRYRRPGESDAGSPSTAHLLEHVLFRSRAGSPAGSLLVRAESFGGQTLAYLTSGVMVLGEVVPSENGMESLDLQLERLRSVPADAADLTLEKQSIAGEIAAASQSPEEAARRAMLAGLGVDAEVEGKAEPLAALSGTDLEKLLDGLTLESDVVIAVVGPHTDREVRQHLSFALKPLRPARTEPRARMEAAAPSPSRQQVTSPQGYHQESFFLSMPDLSTAELVLAQELLNEAGKGRTRLSLRKEDLGLYRLDVSPPLPHPTEVGQRIRQLSLDDPTLAGRLRRRWLDLYELPLDRAEMLALEALDHGSLSSPPRPAELPALRELVVSGLERALQNAPSLLLQPAGSPSERLYPFRETANAAAVKSLQRQTLSNGLTVVSQELRSWPVVAISGFFRLRRPLSPDECALLESKLEARSAAGLDYEVRPDALFFHLWCPAAELTATLEASATEIRSLAESSEVLVERADPSTSPMEEFFLTGLQRPAPAPINGRSLVYPEGGQLVVVGDVEPMALEHGLRPAWNSWFTDKPLRASPLVTVVGPAGETHRTIKRPSTGSPLLLVGVWGPNRSAPDFLAFNLALQTLAGRPTTSLLARQLRDKEGLVETVSVFPMTGSERADGRQIWLIALRPRQVLDDATPLAAKVEGWLSGLGRDALPATELARTRNYLKAALKISTSTPRGRAKVLANSEFYRLSELYSTDYAGLYDRIDAAQVRTVCQKYLGEQTARWLYLQPLKGAEG
jgi:predicted Zn-dependent peptidase